MPKPPLPAAKIALLEGIYSLNMLQRYFESLSLFIITKCIDYKFGKGTMNANTITQKCNQKCLDKGNSKKLIKKEKPASDMDKEN